MKRLLTKEETESDRKKPETFSCWWGERMSDVRFGFQRRKFNSYLQNTQLKQTHHITHKFSQT